ELATARSGLQLAQTRPGGGVGVPMRSVPVPPSRGVSVGVGLGVAPSYGYAPPAYGYAPPAYGYATPGYGYAPGYAPNTGLSVGLTFGNGQTSIWAGAGRPMVGQAYGQVAPQLMVVTDGYRNRWVRPGETIPPGWVPTYPTTWNNIFPIY